MAITGPFRNSTDLVNEALAILGVLASGQPTDPEDFAYVNEKLDAIFRKVAALEIVHVADPSQIPSEWFSDLADIVAGECCTKFGSTPDIWLMLKNAGLGGVQGVDVGFGAAAKSLRAIIRARPTGEPVVAQYL